jgi:superfamily I DNA and/or RNA helicase
VAENTLQKILKSYQKRLTNLTSRNKSLLLLNLSAEQFLDIHELDFLQNKPSFNLVEQLIAQKNTISLCEVHDPRYERVNEVSKRLRKISRTEKFIEEERGSEDLFVGYPIIKGKFSDGTVVRCPLMFFPVTLAPPAPEGGAFSSNMWTLKTPPSGAGGLFNRSFLLAYSHFNQITISDEFLEHSFEDFSKDSLEFRTQLYEFLKDSPLKIDFNKELFVNTLHHFEKQLKSDLELSENNGELKLYPQAVLGIFPQAGSFLEPDYEDLLTAFGSQQSVEGSSTASDLEHLFPSQTSKIENRKSKIREENLLTPFAVDASQELALQQIKSGASMVVQGPPGTGKSQLICNLIADFTARGKKVLVVSQKRAALDVVQERLARAGMRPFVGNVHDFKNDRKTLYAQILDQIEQIEDYQKQNQSLDAIFLERNFTHESRQIDKISETLQEFKEALFEVSECGVSVKELYLTSSPNQPFLNLKEGYKQFKFNEIDDFLKKFERYCQSSPPTPEGGVSSYSFLTPPSGVGGLFWQNRLPFQNRQYSEIGQILKVIQDVYDFVQNLEKESSEILKNTLNFKDLEKILSEKERFQNLLLTIGNEKIYQVFNRNIQEKIKLNTSKISELEAQVAQFFAGQGIEITLPSASLLPFLSKLNEAIDTKSIGGVFWSIFSKEKADIQNVTIANGLSLSLEDLQKLQQRIQNRIGLEKWWNEWGWIFSPPAPERGVSSSNFNSSFGGWGANYRWFERHFQQLYQAEKANKIWKKIAPEASVALTSEWEFKIISQIGRESSPFGGGGGYESFQKKINFIIQKSQQLTDNQIVWNNYLSKNQIEILACGLVETGSPRPATKDSNTKDLATINSHLKENFDLMQESDSLKASFSRSEWAMVELFLAPMVGGDTDHGSAVAGVPTSHFLNSLKLAWIEHIEDKYPILRGVSSLKISQLENDLQDSVQKKQTLSQEILLLKLRELTYQNLEKNRLQNTISYRDLKHQVSKKRKLWSVRKLITEYSEEMFKLVPCWLASPETVSAIFPLEPNFDLVIFDEASQCFAEQGIPALYRGKQVVIAGDSKQLQPNDLYRVRFENDTDDNPELEVDSLLDLACQYLPQTQLRGHYRSKSLDLIDFSNQYFYKNTLSLLPDFQDINLQKPAIQYLKVDGVWENSINQIEAERVIDLVRNIHQTSPQKSIGIVTFNFKQQGLIQDLFSPLTPEGGTFDIKITSNSDEKAPPSGAGGAWASIFVKNIENVQGDERDIIIFSIGYAPDAKGKMAMQFGSLNGQGGENRLNVAVTRAREKIYIVSSILPNQLRVEEAQNEGPRLLKSYLEYALKVSEGHYKPQAHRSEKYRAEWLLKEQMMSPITPEGGINDTKMFVKELPFADITVKNQNVYESLILTDDDLYYEHLSPKETFAYIPANLRAKGWKFERVFSRNFWKNSPEASVALTPEGGI